MPLYVGLLNWTEQGVKAVKDTVKRAQTFRTSAEKAGCKVREVLWTMGPYDAIALFEAPDDITASRATIGQGMQGYVHTLTMRAFTADEMKKVVGGLP